ncbi:MAG: response regulator [Alphaproteobacteria bacterium]|nr:response regulator [Alphaproteobacteria bacterium]
MKTKQKNLLVVDDEKMNLDILEFYLTEEGYEIQKAENGEDAWEILCNSKKDTFNCIILDRRMPGIDGLELLDRIKKSRSLKNIPVIIQTAATTNEEVMESIEAGAFHCLLKPYDPNALLALIRFALEEEESVKNFENERCRKTSATKHMASGFFTFKTLDDVRNLSSLIAFACPNPVSVGIGLVELMINAVEHGNLGITYKEKSKLLLDNTWNLEVEKRLEKSKNKDKKASLSFKRYANRIEIEIKDTGKGFDWKRYLDFDSDRIMDIHGRGIALAKAKSFSSLKYIASGNSVIATVFFDEKTKRRLEKL